MTAAAKNLTPVILELGGKSPVVVDPNCDLKVGKWSLLQWFILQWFIAITVILLKIVAKRIVVGKWGCNNGQACVCPDYIITTKSFAPRLVTNQNFNESLHFQNWAFTAVYSPGGCTEKHFGGILWERSTTIERFISHCEFQTFCALDTAPRWRSSLWQCCSWRSAGRETAVSVNFLFPCFWL